MNNLSKQQRHLFLHLLEIHLVFYLQLYLTDEIINLTAMQKRKLLGLPATPTVEKTSEDNNVTLGASSERLKGRDMQK